MVLHEEQVLWNDEHASQPGTKLTKASTLVWGKFFCAFYHTFIKKLLLLTRLCGQENIGTKEEANTTREKRGATLGEAICYDNFWYLCVCTHWLFLRPRRNWTCESLNERDLLFCWWRCRTVLYGDANKCGSSNAVAAVVAVDWVQDRMPPKNPAPLSIGLSPGEVRWAFALRSQTAITIALRGPTSHIIKFPNRWVNPSTPNLRQSFFLPLLTHNIFSFSSHRNIHSYSVFLLTIIT